MLPVLGVWVHVVIVEVTGQGRRLVPRLVEHDSGLTDRDVLSFQVESGQPGCALTKPNPSYGQAIGATPVSRIYKVFIRFSWSLARWWDARVSGVKVGRLTGGLVGIGCDPVGGGLRLGWRFWRRSYWRHWPW